MSNILRCVHTQLLELLFFFFQPKAGLHPKGGESINECYMLLQFFTQFILTKYSTETALCEHSFMMHVKKKTFWKKKWWVTSKPKIGQYTKKIRSPQVYIQVPTILIFLQYPMQLYNKGLFTRLPFYNIPPNIHAQHWNKKHDL